MDRPRCPGQNTQFWKPEDISYVKCPFCGGEIEFWKDEPVRPCPGCKKDVRNPNMDAGCAEWCKHADDCLGIPIDKPDNNSDSAS